MNIFGRIKRLARLSPAEWSDLWAALVTVALVRLALFALPFGIVRRCFWKQPAHLQAPTWEHKARGRQLGWAVAATRRVFPGASCLASAIALHALLEREGIVSHIRLGLPRDPGAAPIAHAWVEHDGLVLLGGADSPSSYSPFPLM